jgi:TonB family protein
MTALLMTAAFLVLAQAPAGDGARAPVEEVRRLYGAAAYEDALARLSALDGSEDTNLLDQYRALCLIGLGRVADADQALERIVLRSPMFQIGEGEASPDFLARFAAVRRRVLPIAAHRMYARAKTAFEVKEHEAAAASLREILLVLDPEAIAVSVDLANLRQLAEGLLRLTDAELAASTRTVYSALDSDVTPPVEIDRAMPAWNPPAEHAWRWFRGVVQVVVDERGNVERAQLLQSVAEFYDAALVQAARGWRFQPARRDGQPVKYRKLIDITMRPTVAAR